MRYRDRVPGNPRNWELRCRLCGILFRDEQRVRAAEAHFNSDHGGGKVQLDLKWVGFGPAPKTVPKFLN